MGKSWQNNSGEYPSELFDRTHEKCAYRAPLLTWPITENGENWTVQQANCNHWDCPRCGPELARQHYGRIVEGARQVAVNAPLWFITITCRGRHLSRAASEANYLEWTNRLLTNMRTKATRAGASWHYAQVTERQKRGHPHSHILTDFVPDDLAIKKRYEIIRDGMGATRRYYDAYRSEWFEKSLASAGLGSEYDISPVRSTEAASRYVAKYLFKATSLSIWPKGWKRIRYSQSWPKIEPQHSGKAFPLMSLKDYDRLEAEARHISATTLDTNAAWEFWLNIRGRNVTITLVGDNTPQAEQ